MHYSGTKNEWLICYYKENARMKIVEFEGQLEYIKKVTLSDLELIVAAANVAGYMEASKTIEVPSDTELATAVISIISEYNLENEDGELPFPEYVETKLLVRYAIES
jgi:hypothetical protein